MWEETGTFAVLQKQSATMKGSQKTITNNVVLKNTLHRMNMKLKLLDI